MLFINESVSEPLSAAHKVDKVHSLILAEVSAGQGAHDETQIDFRPSTISITTRVDFPPEASMVRRGQLPYLDKARPYRGWRTPP